VAERRFQRVALRIISCVSDPQTPREDLSAPRIHRALFLNIAHLSAVPIHLNDGRNVKGLRVLELKAALESFGVPASEHAQNKADKLSQLKMRCRSFAPRRAFGAPLKMAA